MKRLRQGVLQTTKRDCNTTRGGVQMETQDVYMPPEIKKMSPFVKRIIYFAIVGLIVLIAIILISVSIQKNNIAGTYYMVRKRAAGGYYFPEAQYCVELTKDGKFIDEYGITGTYKYSNGKIVISLRVLGMSVRRVGTLEKGVLTYTDNFADNATYTYVKLDSPPENVQLLDKLPTEE